MQKLCKNCTRSTTVWVHDELESVHIFKHDLKSTPATNFPVNMSANLKFLLIAIEKCSKTEEILLIIDTQGKREKYESEKLATSH